VSAGPSWYDVLGVEPSADAAEIRAAWRAAIADLDPTERRFRSLNQAAEVLLDEQSRAAYDAELAGAAPAAGRGASAASHETPADAEPSVTKRPRLPRREKKPTADRGAPTPAAGRGASAASRETPAAPSRLPLVPAWALVLAAVLATLGVVTATLASVQAGEPVSDDGGALVEQSAEEARNAAVRAVVPVLSFDYRTLEEDAAAARSYMTSSYQEEKYDPLFAVIEENADNTQTVVEVQVVDSAVTRTGDGRVEILLFVDRPTTNRESQEPVVYKDQATLTMAEVDGQWLVDDLRTSPIQE
jgi:Mce-associated membrane protein